MAHVAPKTIPACTFFFCDNIMIREGFYKGLLGKVRECNYHEGVGKYAYHIMLDCAGKLDQGINVDLVFEYGDNLRREAYREKDL